MFSAIENLKKLGYRVVPGNPRILHRVQATPIPEADKAIRLSSAEYTMPMEVSIGDNKASTDDAVIDSGADVRTDGSPRYNFQQ